MSEVDTTWDAQVKAIAANEVSSCISAKQTIIEEHSASFKWLMASMLAINAGGLLKVGELESVSPAHQLTAAVAFLIGILAALAIAWLGQIAGRKMIEPLAQAIAFWTMTSATGEFDEEEHNQVIANIQKSLKFGTRSRWAGWLSVLAFTTGIVAVLTGNIDPAPNAAHNHSTEVIQVDHEQTNAHSEQIERSSKLVDQTSPATPPVVRQENGRQ